MAAKLGEDPDELIAGLVRQIAQDLANGESAQKVTEGLTKGGLSRDQAAKLVDVVVQARHRHENSAEGRAQKRSQGVTRMTQGACWGAGGVAVTLMSMGSGGGRVFFGAVIYGVYLFLSGLVLWGGNTAQVGDAEELKAGPAWLREIRVGEKVRDAPAAAAPTSVPQSVSPTPSLTPKATPTLGAPRPIPRIATTPPRTAPSVPAPLPPRNSESTPITRLYAIAFLWDQIFGLDQAFNILGRVGLAGLVVPLSVLSIMTFVAGVLVAVHVLLDRLEYRFLVLPAYHVLGVVLMNQLWRTPEKMDGFSIVHSAVGLIGGLAWLWHSGQFPGRVRQARAMPRPISRPPNSRAGARPTPRA